MDPLLKIWIVVFLVCAASGVAALFFMVVGIVTFFGLALGGCIASYEQYQAKRRPHTNQPRHKQ